MFKKVFLTYFRQCSIYILHENVRKPEELQGGFSGYIEMEHWREMG